MHQWSGPLPQPEALQRYNQIVPTAAERIIKMAETQHDHRIAIEKNVVDSNVANQRLGTILGFIVAMTAILGGIFLAYEGKETSGVVSIITALVGLAGVFVYGKMEQKKDLASKTQALAKAR
ncbi:MAG: DUF2335 domain-containing protein [Terriglobales bacterium]